jgi:hypothetical protein
MTSNNCSNPPTMDDNSLIGLIHRGQPKPSLAPILSSRARAMLIADILQEALEICDDAIMDMMFDSSESDYNNIINTIMKQ